MSEENVKKEAPYIPPEDRPMKIDSIETFSSPAGAHIKIHLSKRQYLSDESIDLSSLGPEFHHALLHWLMGTK